jgi:hypothetical protein
VTAPQVGFATSLAVASAFSLASYPRYSQNAAAALGAQLANPPHHILRLVLSQQSVLPTAAIIRATLAVVASASLVAPDAVAPATIALVTLVTVAAATTACPLQS